MCHGRSRGGEDTVVPSAGTVGSEHWYYIIREYYDFDENGDPKIQYMAIARTGGELGSEVGGNTEENGYGAYAGWLGKNADGIEDFIPMGKTSMTDVPDGYHLAVAAGGLRVGSLSNFVGTKGSYIRATEKTAPGISDNPTNTALNFYLPTVSGATITNDKGAYDVVMTTYLGNNGRLLVSNTELLVTKQVKTETGELDDEQKNQPFKFVVTIGDSDQEPFVGPRDAVVVEREIDKATGQMWWRRRIDTIELVTNDPDHLGCVVDPISGDAILVDENGTPAAGGKYYLYTGDENSLHYRVFDSRNKIDGSNNTRKDNVRTFTMSGLHVVQVVDSEYIIVKTLESITVATVTMTDDTANTSATKIESPFGIRSQYLTIPVEFKLAYITDETGKTIPVSRAEFWLKDGEGLLFIGLGSGSDYTVTEDLTQKWKEVKSESTEDEPEDAEGGETQGGEETGVVAAETGETDNNDAPEGESPGGDDSDGGDSGGGDSGDDDSGGGTSDGNGKYVPDTGVAAQYKTIEFDHVRHVYDNGAWTEYTYDEGVDSTKAKPSNTTGGSNTAADFSVEKLYTVSGTTGYTEEAAHYWNKMSYVPLTVPDTGGPGTEALRQTGAMLLVFGLAFLFRLKSWRPALRGEGFDTGPPAPRKGGNA